jgi:Flp pilus assembly protein TadD
VEYAVRSRDRVRLTNSYLELADALFRTGAGDKAVAVYGRVLELDTSNERAEFALSTLAPDELVRLRGAPERPDRWTAELDAIEGNAGAEPAADASTEVTMEPPVEGPVAAPPDETEPAPAQAAASPAPTQDSEPAGVDGLELPDPEWGEGFRTPAPVAAVSQEPTEPPAAASTEGASPPKDESLDELVFELAEDLPREVTPTVAPQRIPTPSAADAPFTRMDTPAPIEAVAPRTPTPRATPSVAKPPIRRLTPAGAPDSDFVDLGEWLRHTEPTKSTRMHVEDAKPTGDEQADFDEMLRRFKRGVAENVEAEDFEAHYDLGVAYKEMGLVDEAIAQFQKSLRGESHRVRSYEALGQCFVEQKQYPIAAALLQRATEVPGSDDRQLVGVLYLLGFALEHLGRPAEALQYYLRVFAVDIEFRDIAARIAAMGNLTK